MVVNNLALVGGVSSNNFYCNSLTSNQFNSATQILTTNSLIARNGWSGTLNIIEYVAIPPNTHYWTIVVSNGVITSATRNSI